MGDVNSGHKLPWPSTRVQPRGVPQGAGLGPLRSTMGLLGRDVAKGGGEGRDVGAGGQWGATLPHNLEAVGASHPPPFGL